MIKQGHYTESIVPFRVQNLYISYSMQIEGNEPKYKKEAVVLMKIYKIWKPLKVVPFSLPLFFFYKLYLEVALDLANAPLKNYGKLSEK